MNFHSILQDMQIFIHIVSAFPLIYTHRNYEYAAELKEVMQKPTWYHHGPRWAPCQLWDPFLPSPELLVTVCSVPEQWQHFFDEVTRTKILRKRAALNSSWMREKWAPYTFSGLALSLQSVAVAAGRAWVLQQHMCFISVAVNTLSFVLWSCHYISPYIWYIWLWRAVKMRCRSWAMWPLLLPVWDCFPWKLL